MSDSVKEESVFSRRFNNSYQCDFDFQRKGGCMQAIQQIKHYEHKRRRTNKDSKSRSDVENRSDEQAELRQGLNKQN